nr:DUF982 domain-containing protein [Shimia aestuarii]
MRRCRVTAPRPKNTGTITLIEINWGNPMTFVLSPEGGKQKFTTIEQAAYWLRNKWPVADQCRDSAIDQIDAAMSCLVSVCAARTAFISAAESAGFTPDRTVTGDFELA